MSVDEIGGAVDWIDNKGWSICQSTGLGSLLAEEAVEYQSAGALDNGGCGEIHG